MRLINHKTLTDFPSASAVEYYNNRLYILGDDAAHMLILDTAYQYIDTIRFLSDTAYRISKTTKPDIESSALIVHNQQSYLYAMGSFSSDSRTSIFHFPLDSPQHHLRIENKTLLQKLSELPEVNIEGMSFMNGFYVLVNRANHTHRTNHLVILDDLRESPKLPLIIPLLMDSSTVKGVSGLYYLAQKDLLLFTASEEATANAMEDGAIADSYLGWIKNFSKKLESKSISPDALVNLSGIDPAFKLQKIESVCVEEAGRQQMILHLVADNDNGQSSLFRISLSL
ncbi:MAG: DUF6929 family protein [Flavisolibacter sp.]